ncbi:MAG: hypothetical protein QW491_13785 [Thermoproteota archaeon]
MDYRQGMIDGLELALYVCNEVNSVEEAKRRVTHLLASAKEEKFERIKVQLGILQ